MSHDHFAPPDDETPGERIYRETGGPTPELRKLFADYLADKEKRAKRLARNIRARARRARRKQITETK